MIHLPYGMGRCDTGACRRSSDLLPVGLLRGIAFSRRGERPFPVFAPPVSILKPLHGVDFASYENYASFCRQDYPEYEILFAINDEADRAATVVRRLMADYPQRQHPFADWRGIFWREP